MLLITFFVDQLTGVIFFVHLDRITVLFQDFLHSGRKSINDGNGVKLHTCGITRKRLRYSAEAT